MRLRLPTLILQRWLKPKFLMLSFVSCLGLDTPKSRLGVASRKFRLVSVSKHRVSTLSLPRSFRIPAIKCKNKILKLFIAARQISKINKKRVFINKLKFHEVKFWLYFDLIKLSEKTFEQPRL